MRVRDLLATFRGHRTPRLNLIGRWKWWFALSGFFIVLSLIGLFVRGLNFSIDFEGGALLQYENRTGASVGEIQRTLARFGIQEAEVQVVGENEVSIRTESLTELGDRGDRLRDALAGQAGITREQINEQDVSPTWGGTISRKALQGLIVFLVLVAIYISLRFEWKMAVGALVALAHDMIITAGIYALVGREVTPETVIAILTIMGYSLYDTVVIFDRVKENTESAAVVARETYSGVVNLSLNQVFMRSLNTSLVVLLPIGALLFFGGETLKDFAFALFIGVVTGAYSSIFVACPVLALLKEREPRYQQIRARAAVRAERPGLRAVPRPVAAAGDGSDGELEPAGVASGSPSVGAVAASAATSGAAASSSAATSGAAASGSAAAGSARPSPAAQKRKKGKPQAKAKRRRR